MLDVDCVIVADASVASFHSKNVYIPKVANVCGVGKADHTLTTPSVSLLAILYPEAENLHWVISELCSKYSSCPSNKYDKRSPGPDTVLFSSKSSDCVIEPLKFWLKFDDTATRLTGACLEAEDEGIDDGVRDLVFAFGDECDAVIPVDPPVIFLRNPKNGFLMNF